MKDMNRELDTILKDIVVEEVIQEAEGEKLKTYKTLANLTNLGKTYFINWGEIKKADTYAQTQVLHKFGDEMAGGNSSIIKCSVSYLMDLPDKKKTLSEAVEKTFKQFAIEWNNLKEWIQGKDETWKETHNQKGELNKINNIKFNANGINDPENIQMWKQVQELFNAEPWKSDVATRGKMEEYTSNMIAIWRGLGGSAPEKMGSGQVITGDNSSRSGGAGQEEKGWHPEHAYKITITTNFTQDWFQHKFKSGLINKAIMAVKTSAMNSLSSDSKNQMKDHKYVQDEMLPQDQRKLDSIKWKMTNKVASEYITNLLGWSRKKLKKVGEDGKPELAQGTELQADSGYGKKMADAALSNRGILGRLKQKIFSGGQKSESISVAFQLADPNDGWELEEPKETEITGGEGEPGGETSSEPKPTSSSGEPEGGEGEEVSECVNILEKVKGVGTLVGENTNKNTFLSAIDNLIIGYING